LTARGWCRSIVAQAAIATDAVGDGRILPLVILDTTNFPDIVDLFKIHEKMPPGDADTTWANVYALGSDHITLIFEFQKPFVTKFGVVFKLTAHGSAVDLAMQGNAIYLQSGKPGDRFYRKMAEPRIIAEIGAEMPRQMWELRWQKAIRNRLRAEGVSRSEAKRQSTEHIRRLRNKFSELRKMPPGSYFIIEDPDEITSEESSGKVA
jgi:hypothetical protein